MGPIIGFGDNHSNNPNCALFTSPATSPLLFGPISPTKNTSQLSLSFHLPLVFKIY